MLKRLRRMSVTHCGYALSSISLSIVDPKVVEFEGDRAERGAALLRRYPSAIVKLEVRR